MVQYLLGEDNQQILATRYKLFLHDVKELEAELSRDVRIKEGELALTISDKASSPKQHYITSSAIFSISNAPISHPLVRDGFTLAMNRL